MCTNNDKTSQTIQILTGSKSDSDNHISFVLKASSTQKIKLYVKGYLLVFILQLFNPYCPNIKSGIINLLKIFSHIINQQFLLFIGAL